MDKILQKLGIEKMNPGAYGGGWVVNSGGEELSSINPATGEEIAKVQLASKEDYEKVIQNSEGTFHRWRQIPAPRRGEVIRQIGNEFRKYKKELGKLVTVEVGKTLAEGEGEIQEMIDVADFAVGLSRQLYGLSMHSERPNHRMYEQWHPLGVVGVITAFNFPASVWAWNAMIAAVCGDVVLWKPSSKVPLTAIGIQNVINPVLEKNGFSGIMNMVIGGRETIGEPIIADKRIPLVSATGSVVMGRHVASVVGERLGRTILELGGNNAIILMEDADLNLATRAILFGAIGTNGQRCTTTRRIIVQEPIVSELLTRLQNAYAGISIGDPEEKGILMGPLIDKAAVDDMVLALKEIEKQGGKILFGGIDNHAGSKNRGDANSNEGNDGDGGVAGKAKHIREYNNLNAILNKGYFVEPALVLANKDMPILAKETFAPILYIIPVADIEEAIKVHNDVSQGLSSAMFTGSLKNSERFLSCEGSDCGIANVNIGTSGAEIGGAFGGEKETGGGREAGSDAWKAYMRRQTTTINWSSELPLAQGIQFGDEEE